MWKWVLEQAQRTFLNGDGDDGRLYHGLSLRGGGDDAQRIFSWEAEEVVQGPVVAVQGRVGLTGDGGGEGRRLMIVEEGQPFSASRETISTIFHNWKRKITRGRFANKTTPPRYNTKICHLVNLSNGFLILIYNNFSAELHKKKNILGLASIMVPFRK